MDTFGSTNPRRMPPHFFPPRSVLHFESARQADVSKQNYSVCPRHWYIDADIECRSCGTPFIWSASEQRTWFEHYHFWIDSHATQCRDCRAKRRYLAGLRKEYDSIIEMARTLRDPAARQRVITIVDELEAALSIVPEKMAEARRLFASKPEG